MTQDITGFSLSEIWQKAKLEIAKSTSTEVFDSWFKDLECLGGGEDSIILSAMGEFAAMWIRDNYMDVLSRNVSLAASRNMKVEIRAVELPADGPECLQHAGQTLTDSPRGLKNPNLSEKNARIQHVAPVSTQECLKSINPRNTFETFVVGEGNRFAHAAALAVAQNLGTAFNPLFIYGATGLGKTHLMHAIAQFVLKSRPESRILYISSETFVNEYILALREGNISNFRKRYRNTDLLLIDDVQFFAKKESCQEEFFHTFNELFNSGKQIVLSCDKPVNEVADIEQRLVSRFGWGVSVDIQAPDYETRLAILNSKLSALNGSASIRPEAVDLIARRFTKNVRRMEGALTNLIGYASLISPDNPITLEKVQELLSDMLMQEDGAQSVDIEFIQKKTAEYYKIDLAEMTSKRRPANIALVRQIAMYLCRKLTAHSLQEIGKRFGGRDHGTVMYAIRTVDHEMNSDETVKRSVDFLLKTLSV